LEAKIGQLIPKFEASHKKNGMHHQPGNRVSIITVCLNNKKGLLDTLQSVRSQKGVPVEHIVIDGGSTDGSIEVITRFETSIARWVSEPDEGPYDGMNKGIELITGDWVHFLNAGDVFAAGDSLSRLADLLSQEEVVAVYTDSVADYGDFTVYREASPFQELWKGMVLSHQALLIRASLLKQMRFDTNFPKIADYELILRCLAGKERIVYVPFPLVICDAHGISNRGQASILLDYYRVSGKYFGMDIRRKFWFLRRYLFLAMIDSVKRILPGKMYSGMVKSIRKTDRRVG